MTAGWRRRTSIVALVGLLGLAVLTTGAPARAAVNQYAPSVGTITGTVPSGNAPSAPTVVASGACPAGTQYAQGFLDGPGLVKGVLIASDSLNVATMNTSGIPASFGLTQVAKNAGAVLVNGTYDVSLVCDPGFGAAYTAQYDGQIVVTGGATATSEGTTYTWSGGGSATVTAISLNTTPVGSAMVGSSVTLKATVTPTGAAGTVQFSDSVAGTTSDLGTAVTVAPDGTATYSSSTLGAGPHVLGAIFTPADSKAYTSSTAAAVDFTVLGQGQTATATTLTADPATGVVRGGTATLTATVTPSAAAGTVTFQSGTTTLTQAAIVNGKATVTISPLTAGMLSLTAVFAPSDTTAYVGSTSPPVNYLVADPLTEGPYVDDLTVMGANFGVTTGLATDTLQLQAPQACPAPAGEVSVRISGPQGWALGVPLSSNGFYDTAGSAVNTQPLSAAASAAGLTFVPGKYVIAVTCRTSLATGSTATGFFLGKLWFYDSQHWMAQDPAVAGIPTVTTLTVSPTGKQEVAKTVDLTATVQPADSAGSMVFEAVSGTSTISIGTATIKNGTAAFSVSNLDLGLYYLTGTYTPDGTNTTLHNGSRSAEIILAITKGLPPIPGREAAVTGTAKVGSTVTCTSAFSGQVSVTYQWFRDGAQVAGSAVTRTLVAADAKHLLTCRATATNPGGTVYRDSPAVQVGA
jgi:Bacterial Ig-like domain (group 3)